jgi:uncharacterized protein
MSMLDVQIAGMGLDELDAYLSSDRSPPESMMLSDLDGFLAGIAVGPELVMPSEWLPVVWGGEEPVFADGEEAQAVIGGILSRYNEILQGIERGAFEPIFWTTSDGAVIAADWAEGFLLAIGLRPEAWEPLLHSKRRSQLMFPILALCGDENGDPVLGLNLELADEAVAEATDLLAPCVIAIDEFWKSRRTSRAAKTSPIAKTGRNEPCPCGSGKKFKKCCGQAN